MAFLAPTAIRTTSWTLPLVCRCKFTFRCGTRPSRKSHRSQIRMVSSSTAMSSSAVVDRVFQHWFGSLDIPRFDTLQSQNRLWYSGTKEIDDDIRQRFGNDVEMALDGKLDHLIGSEQYPVKGDLALVILLDQYPRNIYRGSAKAFAGDPKSREVVMGILEPDRWSNAKRILPPIVQVSFLLPLMHQESVEDLDLCAEKIDDLMQDCRDAGEEASACVKILEDSRRYCERHRDIIVRFGRYPYRNAVLGRECTKEETEFLKEGPRFGQ